MGGWLLFLSVVLLLVVLAFMRLSLSTFFLRKSWQSLSEGRRPEWRDPEVWRDSKRAAAIWVAGITGLLALGIALSPLFPDYGKVFGAILVATPVLVMCWLMLTRRR